MQLSSVILNLKIGKEKPRPAPLVVIEALQSVEVTRSKTSCGFQLVFTVGKSAKLQLATLPANYFTPYEARVIIKVILNSKPNVIMDGFITKQDLVPSNVAGKSTLTITGDDLCVAMNRVEKIQSYENMRDDDQIKRILRQYADLGIVANVRPLPIDSTKQDTKGHYTQIGTDLKFIQSLAKKHGYVFYLDPESLPGKTTAYFGPEKRTPLKRQEALSINFDAYSNVESLNFKLDGSKKVTESLTISDPKTGKPITIPKVTDDDINKIKPTLGKQKTNAAITTLNHCSAFLLPEEAQQRAIGRAIRTSTATELSGSLDILRYGEILTALDKINVRGAGMNYDGEYYVDSVTHKIKQGEYMQDFTLSRGGSTAKYPVV